jgi:hypothetical protein
MLDAVRRKYSNLRDRVLLHGSYQNVFGTPEGEQVLAHIAKVGFLTRSTFVAGDPEQTMLNEGSRRLALSILRFVRKDHGELLKQIEKGINDESNNPTP